jgi:hypothetical protein
LTPTFYIFRPRLVAEDSTGDMGDFVFENGVLVRSATTETSAMDAAGEKGESSDEMDIKDKIDVSDEEEEDTSDIKDMFDLGNMAHMKKENDMKNTNIRKNGKDGTNAFRNPDSKIPNDEAKPLVK